MRVVMPAIIDQAGRQFNVDEADGVNRRHRSYTAKARAWGERAQALVEEIPVVGETPALHATVTKLATEVEGDADFQKARQLF